jgi:hypothetical protein
MKLRRLASWPKAFINGNWFTGENFRSATFYTLNGVLTAQDPVSSFETVDLKGGFVVSPFGDAHNHFPSRPEDLADANRAHLDAGVFYTLNPGGDASGGNRIRAELGTPTTIDTVFAHAVFTCSGGHPQPLLEYFADRGEPFFNKASLEGSYFNFLDSIAQIDEVWPRFLSTEPQFVKLILGFSEAHQSGDSQQRSLGLRAEVARELVRRAQLACLRTGAHIENAEDFHTALEAGVDLVMHLPVFPEPLGRKGPYAETFARDDRYVISGKDAAVAATRGTVVVTTAATSCAENFEKPNPYGALNQTEKRFLEITLRNLRQLKNEGVTLAIGSDAQPGIGTLNEIEFLRCSGVFSNLELLKMWSQTTPNAIFPQRKIGSLEEGSEADFLVLGGNPVEDFSRVRNIRMRVKQGRILNLDECGGG